ncbi:P-loop containing nucleoside triphosphate hydrolase protein, partial [Coemansia spiralis]
MPVQVGFSWRSTQRRWTHTLRPYQQECLDICMDNFSQGVKRQAVSLPVGSGKTVIFSNLIKLIKPPTRLATKTLVLAHRRELLEQAATQIKKAAPDLLVEIDQGTRVASPVADVIVASVPTLGHRTNGRLSRYDPKRFKLVVIDEAHHAAANTYLRVVKHFGQDEADSDTLVWGCSATLFRYDDRDLADVFDKVVYHKHFIAMIREGYLSKIKLTTVRTRNSLENVRRFKGDFAVKALSEAVNNEARNKAIVKAYETMAAGKRKSTLVFAVDVEHAKQLCAMFVNYKIRAEVVLGTTKTAERERILQNFRSGKLPVLVNCGILTEGTDIPNIDCMLMARPTCSPILFQQMLGRGMRLFPGKEDCLVLDFVDSVKRGAQMQITVPSLLGLE